MYEDQFPLRLAKLRQQKGVSAREMSLALGQNSSYINMIENRKAFPSMENFFYICEYLNVTPREFFDTDNENPTQFAELLSKLNRLDAAQLSALSALLDTFLD